MHENAKLTISPKTTEIPENQPLSFIPLSEKEGKCVKTQF